MDKLLAMHIAAQLTQAACGSSGGSLPVSADLADNNVRAKNLQVWETFRVYYRGVVGALADTTSWPAPQIDGGQLLPSLLQSAAPMLKQLGLGDLLPRLLTLIPAPTAAPKGPLPDPGAPTTPPQK
jgi:hypothetical protein